MHGVGLAEEQREDGYIDISFLYMYTHVYVCVQCICMFICMYNAYLYMCVYIHTWCEVIYVRVRIYMV